jgi:hypothetical protein
MDTIIGGSFLESFGGLVLADTAEVGGLAGVSQDPLSSSNGILGGAAYKKKKY